MIAGPSGAGKDTLIALALTAFAEEPRLRLARRVVTRPMSGHEDHDSVSEETFVALERERAFALSWRAHGLGYGIRHDEFACGNDGVRDASRDVVMANVSRTVIMEGRRLVSDSKVVLITASGETLKTRILARGREPADGSRISRQGLDDLVRAQADLVIENTGTPAQGAMPLIRFLLKLLDRA